MQYKTLLTLENMNCIVQWIFCIPLWSLQCGDLGDQVEEKRVSIGSICSQEETCKLCSSQGHDYSVGRNLWLLCPSTSFVFGGYYVFRLIDA